LSSNPVAKEPNLDLNTFPGFLHGFYNQNIL
jgi:hypothetical protein